MTATLEIDGDHDTLRFERTIGHGPERVWDAVTDPTQLAAWFPAAVAYERRVGAPMQFDFGGEQGLDVYRGEVLESTRHACSPSPGSRTSCASS